MLDPPNHMEDPPPPLKSWSIHTRREIIAKYEILERIGSGAYSDVYKGRRLSDSLTVALKEVHDYQSAFREIEALQTLHHSPNIITLHEYFWSEDEDAVLILEFLPTDLASLINQAKKEFHGGLTVPEIKRWIVQILCGIDACHRSSIVHRDLKPSNLLISFDGVLKLADFGQARILLEPGFVAVDYEQNYSTNQENVIKPCQIDPQPDALDEIEKESNVNDGDTSCLATCTASEVDEEIFKASNPCAPEEGENDRYGPLTSCVGTRWFRAPELLYGSTSYGLEIDLWSLGCIFAELFSLEPIFPGTSDIDQLSRIFSVLGNLSEEVWPGCSKLPDYSMISFGKVENPTGLVACLPNRSPDEILLVKKLLCFDPLSRATPMELLHDKYLNEEPLPSPISELRVPSKISGQDEGSPGGWCDYRGMDSDSDFDDFAPANVTSTDTGFSIRFP